MGLKDSLVGIDVALAPAELVAATPPTQKIYDGPPILAVEILSPNDTHEDIVEMVSSYLEVGSVVWVVDPDFETVTVHQPGRESETFHPRQELSGDPISQASASVWPGFLRDWPPCADRSAEP